MGYKEIFSEAKKELGLADHIFMVALPLVKDKNVFLSVLEHLNKSVNLAMRAYIKRQRELKKIRILPESEDLSRRLFLEEFTKSLGITTSERHIINELNLLVKAHRKSQAEIKRGEDYIIFLPNFETVTVNESNIKRYLSIARNFINKIERCLNGATRIGTA